MIIGQAGAGVYIDDLTHRVHRPDSSGDTVGAFMIGEQIVRCRDCKHCVADPEPIDPGWPLMCDDTGRDMLEPYGFCAWGERRAMTSATEDLRALLDERGVEHYDGTNGTLWGKDASGYRFSADELTSGRMSVHMWCETPEQAVAATLGPGTCKDATIEEHTQAFTCSECGCWVAYDEYWETGIYVEGEGQAVHIHPRYCPNCGRKVEE